MSQLDKIEKRIRDVFESGPSILSSMGTDERLLKHFSEAIHELFIHESPREYLRPGVRILLNPQTASRWQSQIGWESKLADLLTSSAVEFGFSFHTSPEINLIPDQGIDDEEIRIALSDQPLIESGETGVLSMGIATGYTKPARKNPTLILQGSRTIKLTQAVINIGRKSSNQIVINDLRVSRMHAQLRRVKEDYMIFDVGSTGGTFINSNRIDSHTLRPGDVISLSGFTMIYTFDQSPVEETQRGITSEIKNAEEKKEED